MKITQTGYDQLKEELERLETQDKPEITRMLREAIAEGDLSENAAYSDAKDRQAFTEERIYELKEALKQAQVQTGPTGGKVGVGSTIRVKNAKGDERTFIIAGPHEANPSEGKISYDSPLGGAFLNHKKGDTVRAKTPGGEQVYIIQEIQ